jgi:1-acyl-sn-glycerol-3-phosphate acyltransferase
VANHASWLDILVLGAAERVTFVAKAEVASWPGIGIMARATGTVFVRRVRQDAAAQARLIAERIESGDRLVVFPEGTSTDGLRVLDFRPSLFAGFFPPLASSELELQPVSLCYTAPPGMDRRFYGWWGDMALGPHLLQVLSSPRQGAVGVILHKPLRPQCFPDRKALAAAAWRAASTPFKDASDAHQ